MSKTNFVAIDLGASGTRAITESGKILMLRNNFYKLDTSEEVYIMPNKPEDVLDCLEFSIVKTGGASNFFPVVGLLGEMAARKSSLNITPDLNKNKYDQLVNYVSAIITCAVAKTSGLLNDRFNLYLAVPPSQKNQAQKKFAEELTGTFIVNLPKFNGGTQVQLDIASVRVMEESVMASTSFFFMGDGSKNPKASDFLGGTLVSLDIGASTSDLAVVKNGVFQEQSGKTFSIGGNVVRDMFINEYYDARGIEVSPEAATQAIAEGRMRVGNSYEDVSSYVREAKKRFAEDLTAKMNTYFKLTGIQPSDVQCILVSGGGSLQSKYFTENNELKVTVDSVSKFVTDKIRELCPYTAVVEYGEEARFANIKGLFIRARFDQVREERMAAAQAAPQNVATPVGNAGNVAAPTQA